MASAGLVFYLQLWREVGQLKLNLQTETYKTLQNPDKKKFPQHVIFKINEKILLHRTMVSLTYLKSQVLLSKDSIDITYLKSSNKFKI